MPVQICDLCCVGRAWEGRCDFCGSPMPSSGWPPPPMPASALPALAQRAVVPPALMSVMVPRPDVLPSPGQALAESRGGNSNDLFSVTPTMTATVATGVGIKYCPSCSIELPSPVPRRCPKCDVSLTKADAVVKCAVCGKNNPIRDDKCTVCGSRL